MTWFDYGRVRALATAKSALPLVRDWFDEACINAVCSDLAYDLHVRHRRVSRVLAGLDLSLPRLALDTQNDALSLVKTSLGAPFLGAMAAFVVSGLPAVPEADGDVLHARYVSIASPLPPLMLPRSWNAVILPRLPAEQEIALTLANEGMELPDALRASRALGRFTS